MIIELTATKALSIESIKIGDTNYVSLRQMWKKKGEEEWKPGRQGLTIAQSDVKKVVKKIKVVGERDDKRFKTIAKFN